MAKTAEAPARRESEMDNQNRSDNLQDSPTMKRLLAEMAKGTDIGHQGQFVFVSVARHFMGEDEIVRLLSKQPDMDEMKARAQYQHISERGYNPPRRERILEMQTHQEFQIIENPDDPDSGNLYRELQFPDAIYEDINEYYEEKSAANDA